MERDQIFLCNLFLLALNYTFFSPMGRRDVYLLGRKYVDERRQE
jgi:hypothetical protein